MQDYLNDLCNAVDINKVSDLDLLALSEQCAILEERIYDMLDRLSEHDRALIRDYIDTRNDLECESLKAALRWGTPHAK